MSREGRSAWGGSKTWRTPSGPGQAPSGGCGEHVGRGGRQARVWPRGVAAGDGARRGQSHGMLEPGLQNAGEMEERMTTGQRRFLLFEGKTQGQVRGGTARVRF